MNMNDKECKEGIGVVSQESRNTYGIDFTVSTPYPGGRWFVLQ